MITRRKFFVVAALFALVLLGVGINEFLRGPRSIFAGFDRSAQRDYEMVLIGMSRHEVLLSLGEPRTKTDFFNLPQKKGFEHHFKEAEQAKGVIFYQWINGMNWYYCIGFDAEGKVVVKGEGHS